MQRSKKFIIILIIVITIVVISSCIIGYIYFKNRIVDDNTGFTLVDQLDADVYSKKKISDYIKKIDGKIIENKNIDTNSLGDKEISFLYYNEKKRKRRGTFKIAVKDKEAPLIWLNNSYSVKRGSDANLEKDIMCVDNYDNKPNCKVEGDYDLNKIGKYPLHYVAIDSSNNKTEISFTLNVYEPKSTSTKSLENSKTSFSDVVKTYKNDDNEIGIDVSKWQGEIDFSKTKDAGASFVMIRIGTQKGVGEEYQLDPYFEENMKKAQKENLKVGIYFYSYADSIKEAENQAKWVVNQVKNYELQLPIVFDWECYSYLNQMELSLFGLNQVADSFLSVIEKSGYDAMLYGSKNYLNSIWKYHSYNVWLAHYTEKTDYQSDYVMWQLCQDGTIDGINGAVDIDILYKNKKD